MIDSFNLNLNFQCSAVIDGIPTEILVITSFDSNDVGSYVCRTNNTAGQDAAVVTLVG